MPGQTIALRSGGSAVDDFAVARDGVCAVGENDVSTGAARDRILAAAGHAHHVPIRSGEDRIDSGTSDQNIVTSVAVKLVPPGSPVESVIAAESANDIVSRRPDYPVRPFCPAKRLAGALARR